MTLYKYETHLHTAETSRCGKAPAADLVRTFKSLGYTGVFVTDHFYNSSPAGEPDLSWHERVEQFCLGYETAAQEGKKVGLDVFFGWEYSHGWAHYLVYGLSKEWLLANPDLPSLELLAYFDRVHEGGGSVIHAHPFRERVEIIQLVPGKMDAIEVINAGRPEEANRHARDFALSFGLPQTAGSDIHALDRKRLCGVSCPRRLQDGRDYIAALVAGETVIFDEAQ